jgi:ABC-2 type transport system permease protein
MNAAGWSAALANEWLKIRRSRVPIVTFVVLAIGPLAGGLFIYIAADPQRAKDLGLLGQKAELSGITADWPGMLMFSTQIASAGALLLFSFIVTWMFGREFVDGTAHYLMSLPVSRGVIVAAKFALYAVWAALLGFWLTAVTFAVGLLMRLPGWSASLAVAGASGTLRACLLTILAITPIAYVASRSRGYLAPLGCAIGLLAVAQVAAILGWGAYIPWAIPAVAAGVAPDQEATAASWLIVVATGALGILATIRWWRSPDAGL